MSNEQIPSPWLGFLRELDSALSAPVQLHCSGGFVVSVVYGFPRPTVDLDYVSAVPGDCIQEIQQIAGMGSALARKHKVHLHYVAVQTQPENYQERLVEVLPHQMKKLRLFVLEPYDLVLSKLERNSPKDQEDVQYLARRLSLDPLILHERYQQEMRPYLARESWHDQTLQFWIEAYFATPQ